MEQSTYNIEVDKHLPDDIHTRLCYIFVQAATENDWRRLLPYCEQNICIVDYGNGTYSGQTSKVLGDFWRRAQAQSRYMFAYDYWIHLSRFYARAVVLVQRQDTVIRYVAFRVENDLITHITIVPYTMRKRIRMIFNPIAELPFRTDYLDTVCGEDVEPQANHLPCMACGALSETLLWRKITLQPKADITLEGEVSVCPRCHRQAELHISKQIDNTPAEQKENYADLPF